MTTIHVSSTEQANQILSPQNLTEAISAIETDGFVVLSNAIQHDHLDLLRERMILDSGELIKAERWGGAGRLKGHLQQGPPPFAPYVFSDIVANPFAIQVTTALLGAGVYNRFYSGNTNCPGSQKQPLHRDGPPLWPQMKVAHPSASLIINVSLIDVTAENGGTELWPGTHLETSVHQHVDADAEAQRREMSPPIRATAPKGSLLIRDNRLWHRGVPNQSDTIRHMIAMIHNAAWLQRPTTLYFHENCREAFPDNGFDHNVTFTPKPLTYLTTRYATPENSS